MIRSIRPNRNVLACVGSDEGTISKFSYNANIRFLKSAEMVQGFHASA
jgi:hypothetical protein